LSAPPDPLAAIGGLLLRGGEGRKRRRKEGKEGREGREGGNCYPQSSPPVSKS